MSIPSAVDAAPIEGRDQLVAYLESAAKPASDWLIGTEHEKFAFCTDTLRPLPYDGARSIRAILEGLVPYGWEPLREGETIVGLTDQTGANVSLEPGGQLELSGAPLRNIHETCAEVNEHLRQVKEIGEGLGTGMLGLGFIPKWARADMPWMPKGRYKIMREYMPKRGSLGLDMMLRSCTVQVNLDFGSEADMVQKFRIGLALQPVATALFANSPFVEGRVSGYESFRSHVWTDTDPDRCGMLDFVFEDGFGFERWIDYVLDVPMYFVYRKGSYIDASGQSFRDFMTGDLPAYRGHIPTMADWADHMTTVFPEVRLKKYLEMRGADGGPWRRLCALPALWVGLLYDGSAQEAAWDLVKDWTDEERNWLRDEVPKTGLATPFRGGTVQDLAKRVLEISRAGLVARAKPGQMAFDETEFLAPLERIADSGISPAGKLVSAYQERWEGSVDPVYVEEAY